MPFSHSRSDHPIGVGADPRAAARGQLPGAHLGARVGVRHLVPRRALQALPRGRDRRIPPAGRGADRT